MSILLNRRAVLAALAAAPLPAWAASDPLTLWWEDLAPKDDEAALSYEDLKALGGWSKGEVTSPWAIQPPSSMVSEYNDRIVRIPGYVVPLAYDGLAVTEGLLVPYVGACIHVPPPPANQIVYLQLKETKDVGALWDPVWATGRFDTIAVETDLAEVGYVMSEAELAPYDY